MPALRQALVAEFLKEADRQSARESAGQFSSEFEGDYLGDLLEAIARDDDARIVPGLVRMLGSGATATSTLARFGEVAVGLVLDAVEDYERIRSTDLAGALMVLTDVFDGPMRGRLSDKSVRRSQRLVDAILTKRQNDDLVVLFALDTAAATRDPELVAIVATIRDRGAVPGQAGSPNPA
ncbi:MAG: hypothetical protein Q7V01_15110, partial [Vicinamibacterales bacterium]|nr:hypothetical protein [Vicinamibacterales bacterium]